MMTVEEIYAKLASHMIKGLMIHESFANYYYFLNLPGYGKFHDKQYREESKWFRKLNRYHIQHHGKLIPKLKPDSDIDVIPSSFYSMKSCNVDMSTVRSSVKNGLERWVEWEHDTKKLYENMYSELVVIGEIASAMFVADLIREVDDELTLAKTYWLNKKATDYDMSVIIEEQ